MELRIENGYEFLLLHLPKQVASLVSSSTSRSVRLIEDLGAESVLQLLDLRVSVLDLVAEVSLLGEQLLVLLLQGFLLRGEPVSLLLQLLVLDAQLVPHVLHLVLELLDPRPELSALILELLLLSL